MKTSRAKRAGAQNKNAGDTDDLGSKHLMVQPNAAAMASSNVKSKLILHTEKNHVKSKFILHTEKSTDIHNSSPTQYNGNNQSLAVSPSHQKYTWMDQYIIITVWIQVAWVGIKPKTRSYYRLIQNDVTKNCCKMRTCIPFSSKIEYLRQKTIIKYI